MRIVFSCLALMMAAPGAYAEDVAAPSSINSVTVFLSGAEVTRTAKAKLEKGDHTIILNDLPPTAIPGSIRVEGKATGKLAIGSVDTARKLLQRAESAAADVDRHALEDQLQKLRDDRAIVDADARAAETQQALVTNLAELPKRPPPSSSSYSGEDWPRVLSVITQGSQDAARLAVEATRKLRDLDEKISDAEKKLSALVPPRTEQTEVRVHATADTPLEVDLTVRYQVPLASWAPIYDARLTTGSKTEPAKLVIARRAAIRQQTGEVWNDVALKLSTTRPSQSAAMPEMNELFVDYEPEVKPMAVPAPVARLERRKDIDGQQFEADAAATAAGAPLAAPPLVEINESLAKLSEGQFEATFDVPGRVTVADTGEVKRVLLATETVEPKLSVRTAPKFDTNAYLYAAIKTPSGTPLLPGQVYLFRDDTYVGNGELPLLQPNEEHLLGFGVDDLVKVRHAVLEEKRGEQGLISTSHVDSRNYRVTVKNLHERPIDATVLDRIPVSRNAEIKVDYTGKLQPTAKDIDDKRGLIGFDEKLDSDEEAVIEYGYRITWPTSKSIVYGP